MTVENWQSRSNQYRLTGNLLRVKSFGRVVLYSGMKFLFRASHSIEAQSLKDLLQSAGIHSTTRNETSALFGDGIVHTEGMPEIWVEDYLFERALDVKRDWIEQRQAVA